MEKSLIVVGSGEFAAIACEYFERDTDRKVAAFLANRSFIEENCLLGRPVMALEDAEEKFPPDRYSVHVAINPQFLNRARAKLFLEMKEKGYSFATYVSPRAFVDPSAVLGDNVFIFEDNVIQRDCVIGDNTVLWSGNHIGHRSRVGQHVFISSHVVLSDSTQIGDYSFLGVNSSFVPMVKVGQDCTIGAGATVTSDVPDDAVVKPARTEIREKASRRYWKVDRFMSRKE